MSSARRHCSGLPGESRAVLAAAESSAEGQRWGAAPNKLPGCDLGAATKKPLSSLEAENPL